MKTNVSRFRAFPSIFIGLLAAAIGLDCGPVRTSQSGNSTGDLVQDWDKTFPKSRTVVHRKATFKNRYGISLAADLYVPKNPVAPRLAVFAVSGPFGAVKEQSSGLYAQNMAERGFVALAFDPSFTGESGGQPRNVPSPEIYTEDFSAAVDFLGLQSNVDRTKIGIIGVCGFGSLGLNAAAVDTRIKAVVTTSMYDMSRVMSKGLNDSLTIEQRSKLLDSFSLQRWADAENALPAPGPRNLPDTLSGNTDPITREFFEYYKTPRGFHKNAPNSNGAWTATGPLPFMNFTLMTYIKEISPRPILIVAGENAHSRYFSEDAYRAAAEPKELLIVAGANHVDLYDDLRKIPLDKIESFFREHLK